LAIPPAWRDIWICRDGQGHIQAIGRDVKGRKQYRYHPAWRMLRDGSKYDRMAAFGRSLPMIRRRVESDLALPGLPREKILATVVRLLDVTLIRVGNEEYARHNDSFGLATLRDRHVAVNGTNIHFEFMGKSGIRHAVDVEDKRLASIIRKSRDLPGYELFQYLDESGARHTIHAADVNEYLKRIAGNEFTAKDFRTWTGTVLATRSLSLGSPWTSHTEAKRRIVRAVEVVARQLRNTKAICRKCYIHPDIITAYLKGRLGRLRKGTTERRMRASGRHFSWDESAALAILGKR
jgi:DNA topoisomerase-1